MIKCDRNLILRYFNFLYECIQGFLNVSDKLKVIFASMHRTSAGVSTVNNKTVTFSKPSKISQHSTVSLLRKTWGESGYNLIELLSTTLKLLDGVSVKHSTHNIVFVFFFILNYGKSHTSIWYDETTTSVVFVLFKTLMQINNKKW